MAVRLIVQGLRRRLSGDRAGATTARRRGSRASRPPVAHAARPEALETLTAVTDRPPAPEDVLRAADAVEMLWEELKPT